MSRVGILPAGGRAERFGGVFKELLPVGDETLLRRTVGVLRAGAACPIVIPTTPEKVAAQMKNVQDLHGVQFVQSEDVLFESILKACEVQSGWYLFAMPDTLIPAEAFYRKLDGDFVLGLFKTKESGRFGVLHSGRIVDKDASLVGTHWAWGVAAWSRRVVDFWIGKRIPNHTDAFNMAMGRFGLQTFNLAYYYDVASWAEYQRLVSDILPVRG